MSFNMKVSGTWQTLTKGYVKIAGTWQQIQSAWVKVAGTWQQVYVWFTASVSDSTPSGSNSGAAPSGSVTSNTTTVTPSGGTAPYTYAWTINGSPATSGPFTCTAPTGATTAWNATVGALDADKNEVWKCTVTDDDANTTEINVTVTLTWTDTT